MYSSISCFFSRWSWIWFTFATIAIDGPKSCGLANGIGVIITSFSCRHRKHKIKRTSHEALLSKGIVCKEICLVVIIGFQVNKWITHFFSSKRGISSVHFCGRYCEIPLPGDSKVDALILLVNFYMCALLFMLWWNVDGFISTLVSAVWVSPEQSRRMLT